MSAELIGVMVGGAIGIIGTLIATIITRVMDGKRNRKSIVAIAAAEVVAIKEKAQRYLNDSSSAEELGASEPMLTSIASQLGYLTVNEAVALRRTITLDMELRIAGNKEKATQTIEACREALSTMNVIS
jgi:gas vesicle protein